MRASRTSDCARPPAARELVELGVRRLGLALDDAALARVDAARLLERAGLSSAEVVS